MQQGANTATPAATAAAAAAATGSVTPLVYITGGVGALLLLLVIEVVCDKLGSPVRPSSVTRCMAIAAVYVFTQIGRLLGKLSGIMDYIDLEMIWRFIRDVAWDFTKAFLDITLPIAQTVLSPWYAIKEYFLCIEVLSHPFLVLNASLAIVMAVVFALAWYGYMTVVRQWMASVSPLYYIVGTVVVCFSSMYFNFFDKFHGYTILQRLFQVAQPAAN